MSMTITACEVPSGPLKLRTDAEGAAPQFKLETFDRKDAPLDKVVEAIRWNGGVVVKNFLNAAELEQAEKAVRPFLDKAQYPSTEDPTKRLARLPTVNPELTTKIFTDDLYLGIIDEFLSVEFDSWLGNKSIKVREQAIATMSSIFEVGPGAKKQDLHRDDAIWYNNIPRCAPGQYERGRDKSISFFIAGCKTTVENGATMFIPGSHLTKWDDQPDPRLAVSAELDAGDAFFMLSSCYHGAGENSTKDQYRLVYAMFSMQPHLRQVCFSLFTHSCRSPIASSKTEKARIYNLQCDGANTAAKF